MSNSFLSLFRRITPLDLAKQQLAQHETELVKNREIVAIYTHSVNCNVERIQDLTQIIASLEEGKSSAKVTTPAKRSESRRPAPKASTNTQFDPALATG